jgi:hypothetical protein
MVPPLIIGGAPLLPAFSSEASNEYFDEAFEFDRLNRDEAPEDVFCIYPLNVRGSFHSSRWPPVDGSIREENSWDGLSLSLRKMEKAIKARITNPPTVPPTMRIVLVLLLLEVVEPEFCALDVAEVVAEEEAVVDAWVG